MNGKVNGCMVDGPIMCKRGLISSYNTDFRLVTDLK